MVRRRVSAVSSYVSLSIYALYRVYWSVQLFLKIIKQILVYSIPVACSWFEPPWTQRVLVVVTGASRRSGKLQVVLKWYHMLLSKQLISRWLMP